MSNNNRELSQFASRITVDDTTNKVSIASTLELSGGADLEVDGDVEAGAGTFAGNIASGDGILSISNTGTWIQSGGGVYTRRAANSTDPVFQGGTVGAINNVDILANGVASFKGDLRVGSTAAFAGTPLEIEVTGSASGAVGISLINSEDSDADATCVVRSYQENRAGGDIVFGRENADDWSASYASAYGFISFNPTYQGSTVERLRITSSGRVGIGSEDPDGLLTIQGNSNATSTPSIRLKDGTDSREVSITNASGDFVVSTHGSDDATHGSIKIFELGKIQINTGGAYGTLTTRVGVSTEGAVNFQRPFVYLDGQYFIGDNTFKTIAKWDDVQNQGGGASMLIIVSNHTAVTGGKCGLWKQYINYNGTLSSSSLSAIDAGGITLETQVSGGNFQVKAWDGGTGLSTAMRIAIIFNDGRKHIYGDG